jgi:predicted RNA-binding protein YlqC (UPF0109 family)
MKDLIEYIIKQIVNNPDAVVIEENDENDMTMVNLTVAKEDMGLVIGKSGNTIKALRKLLSVKGKSEGVRVNLNLVEA